MQRRHMYPFFLLSMKKGKGYHIFNPVDNRGYSVNYTGMRILEFCNGSHTVDQIARMIAKGADANENDSAAFVVEFLDDMTRLGMIAWRTIVGAAPEYPPPQTVFWDLTEACNLQCTHCYFPRERAGENELSTDEVKLVIDEMASFGVSNIVFSGGEPFLRHDILEILHYATRYSFTDLSIASNGTLITSEIAKSLRKSRVRVQVSIDGDTAELHDGIRGVDGSFDAVLGAIRILQGEGIRVSACTVATKVNIECIPNIISLMRQMDVSYRVQGMMPLGSGNINKNFRLTPARMKQLVEYLEAQSVPVSSYNFTLKDPPTAALNWDATGGCSAATTCCSITAEGRVVPCTHFWGIRSENVREHSFPWIWENSVTLRYFRSISVKEVKGICRECDWLSICQGGCKAENFLTGDILSSNKSCWVASRPKQVARRGCSTTRQRTSLPTTGRPPGTWPASATRLPSGSTTGATTRRISHKNRRGKASKSP